MGVVKRSVSFDADVWDGLVAEAGSGAVSPLVNDALAHYLRRQRGLAAVAAYESEHGAFSDDELAEADRLLDAAGVADLTAPTSKRAGPKRAAKAKIAVKKAAAKKVVVKNAATKKAAKSRMPA
jgi:hypothetical protein